MTSVRYVIMFFLLVAICVGCQRTEYSNDEKAFVAAAKEGDMEGVRMLLDKGVDINVQAGYDGMTALGAASSGKQTELALFLIERGADVWKGDFEGLLPIHFAAASGDIQLIEYYLSMGIPIDVGGGAGTPLFFAASEGEVAAVEYLISRGANVNAQWWNGYSVLHEAVLRERIEVTRILLENGANVHAQGLFWKTPLEEAARYGEDEMAEVLEEYQ